MSRCFEEPLPGAGEGAPLGARAEPRAGAGPRGAPRDGSTASTLASGGTGVRAPALLLPPGPPASHPLQVSPASF